MSLRFRRSLRIAPGIRLNLGLHGAGVSVGPRGLHVGMNRRGMYSSAGIPGTGIYAVHHFRGTRQLYPEVQSGAGPVLFCVLLALVVVAVLVIRRAG